MARCYDNLLFKRESGNYKKYLDQLYEYFKNELLNENLTIKGKPIKFREYPPEGLDKEEAFYHLTCRHFDHKLKHRFPDFRRAERIRLIKPIIQNFLKCEECLLDNDCNGILIWIQNINGNDRIHLYLQEERFIIVLEKRSSYYLLITSFYVDNDKNDYYIKMYDKFHVTIDEI